MTARNGYLQFIAACQIQPEPVDYMIKDGMFSYRLIPGDDSSYIVFCPDESFFCIVSDGK